MSELPRDGNFVPLQGSAQYGFSEEASLANGEFIQSGWIDLERYDKYQFEGAGSANGSGFTLTLESSSSPDGQGSTVTTNTITTNTFFLFNVIGRQRYCGTVANAYCAVKLFTGSSDKLSVFPLNVAPSDFSQAALTRSVVTGQNTAGEYNNLQLNQGGAILTSEFLTEVALGNVENYETGTKFGRNPDIDIGSTPEDMWNGGSEYTGFPTGFTPETVDVFSSSAADDSAGTGARTIRIFGLASPTATEYTSEDITMDGTTAVTSSGTWWRINRAFVLTAGSNGENQGTITVRSTTTTANVFVEMPTFNQTTIGAYTVPAERTMVIRRIRVSITRTNGSAGSATVTLRVRESESGVFRAIRVFELDTSSPVEYTSVGGDVIPAGSDIKFRIEDVSDNATVAEGAFEYVLVNSS
jgi:hypothetical protein